MIESPVAEHAPGAGTSMGKVLSQDRIACLCRGFSLDVGHARHVVALSDGLFAATGHLHGLTKPCRHLLHAAAVLCAAGAPGEHGSGRPTFPEALLKSALPDLSASERRIVARSVALCALRRYCRTRSVGPRPSEGVEGKEAEAGDSKARIADEGRHSHSALAAGRSQDGVLQQRLSAATSPGAANGALQGPAPWSPGLFSCHLTTRSRRNRRR